MRELSEIDGWLPKSRVYEVLIRRARHLRLVKTMSKAPRHWTHRATGVGDDNEESGKFDPQRARPLTHNSYLCTKHIANRVMLLS